MWVGIMNKTRTNKTIAELITDSQLTSDHLTQARAILRPVGPSGRSPNNAAIYAYIPSLLTKNAVTRANTKYQVV
jgi:hypothetical protein